jgi:hypothetical protein
VLLAEGMAFFMLGLEVEHINREANIFEEGFILDMLSKAAVVVEDDVIGFEQINMDNPLEEFLKVSGKYVPKVRNNPNKP